MLRLRVDVSHAPPTQKPANRWLVVACESFEIVDVRFRGYSSIAFVENNARIAMQRRLCNNSNGFTRMEETPLYYLAIISLYGNRRRRGHFPDTAG